MVVVVEGKTRWRFDFAGSVCGCFRRRRRLSVFFGGDFYVFMIAKSVSLYIICNRQELVSNATGRMCVCVCLYAMVCCDFLI